MWVREQARWVGVLAIYICVCVCVCIAYMCVSPVYAYVSYLPPEDDPLALMRGDGGGGKAPSLPTVPPNVLMSTWMAPFRLGCEDEVRGCSRSGVIPPGASRRGDAGS